MAEAGKELISQAAPPNGTAAANERGRRGWTLGICLALAAITFAVFGQTRRHEFISLDDAAYIYENPIVAPGLTCKGAVLAFTHAYSANWHPLTWLSHMLDCQLYGLHPGGHHLTNVLIHIATVIALFLVLRQMTGALWHSAFVAAVFAIHPLRVESVAWVAERKDVLSGLFFMLTIGAYVRYVRRPWSLINYGLVTLLFAMGLMCKPMLVTLPLVLLLLDYWPLRRFALENQPRTPMNREQALSERQSNVKRLLYEKAPLLALSGISCGITLWAQRIAIHSGGTFSLPYRLGNAVVTLVVYLVQMVWPVGLAVYYPFPTRGIPLWQLALSGLVLAGISLIAWRERRTRPWLLVGWLWYLVLLLPVIGILQVGTQAHADRYTYLPQIGICAALTWWVGEWRGRPAVLGGLATGVLALLMACTWKQTNHWQNGETLWVHTISCTKDNDMAHYCLGHDLFEKGRVDDAIEQFREALQIHPGYADAHNGLAICLYQKGKIDDAISQYHEMLKTKPQFAPAHNGLGLCLYHLGRMKEAISEYQKALQSLPDYVEAHNNLGNSLFQLGRIDEASSEYQKALALQPDFAEAHNNLGLTLYRQRRMDDAISQYQIALKFKPDYAEARNNLGNCFFQLGRMEEAIAQYEKAREIEPNAITAHMNLGAAFFQLGRVEEAISEFRKAVEIQPDLAAAHDSLGMALVKKGNAGEAIVHFQKSLEIKPSDPKIEIELAWVLATSAQASLRNGQKAVELAQQACAQSGGKDPVSLETLAAAFAEIGRFDEARRSVQKAMELAQAAGQPDFAKQLQSDLRRYETGLPLHP